MNGKFYKNIRKYIILAKGYILININTTSINFKKEIRTLFIPPKIWPLRLSLSIIGMITINSQEIRYFYRNIVKSGNVYRIKYNNKDYGEFKKLSDALYERDALFYCNFDYDLLVESDLENKYENMKLPPFPEKRPKGRIKGSKINKEEREGKIHFDHKKREFFVQKGETIFGYYKSMTEAYYYKKKLMDNNWDMNALKTMISLRIDINKKLDLNKEYSVKLNYCPKCRHKLKNKEKECPYCGIDIKDYLYNK